MGWTTKEAWFASWQEQEIFLCPWQHRLLWSPPRFLHKECQGPFARDKAAKALSRPPTPSSAKVENEWRYTSAPPNTFMVYTRTTFSLPVQFLQQQKESSLCFVLPTTAFYINKHKTLKLKTG